MRLEYPHLPSCAVGAPPSDRVRSAMVMSKEFPMGSREEVAASLGQRAKELWGPRRAEAIHSVIEQTAEHIWQVSQNLPADDEEPGFYL